MNDVDDRLLKRFTAIKNIDYYIEESVYYRTHFSELKNCSKTVLWNTQDNQGRINIYEN